MDKEEIAKIKKAIRLIHHKEKHYEGLNILARLVGWSEFDPLTGAICTKFDEIEEEKP